MTVTTRTVHEWLIKVPLVAVIVCASSSVASSQDERSETPHIELSGGVWSGVYKIPGIDDVPVTVTIQDSAEKRQVTIRISERHVFVADLQAGNDGLVNLEFGDADDMHSCELTLAEGRKMHGDCRSDSGEEATLNLTLQSEATAVDAASQGEIN